jgi:Na+-driven multidrug efflux pump
MKTMSIVKNLYLLRVLIGLVFSILLFTLYFNTERCLKPGNAGFWLIFVSGMCLGVALTNFVLYLRKEKPMH